MMSNRGILVLGMGILIAGSTAVSSADTLESFAQQCDEATGVTVPDFNVDEDIGTLNDKWTNVLTTRPMPPDARYPQGTCDRPNVLNGVCDPGSRFRVLVNTPTAYVVAHARKQGLPAGEYGDIAVIQHNTVNGATCFYQGALHLNRSGNVKAPSRGVGNPPFWMTPSEIVNSRFPCVACHDNGPIIRSPYLAQITGPNKLPGAGDNGFNKNQPYSFVGSDFASWKAYKVEVNGNICNACHRMGVNNVSRNGTARDLGIRATAPSQAGKHPHDAASPIWMVPNQIIFNQATFDAATTIEQCAAQFQNGQPLPSTESCRISLFATAESLGLIVYGWNGTQMITRSEPGDMGQREDALSWLVADIDGEPDRKVELLQPWPNGDRLGLIVYGWDGTKMTQKWSTENIGEGANALSWLVADVDGDQKADLLQPWQNGDRLGLIVYSWDGTQMKKKWGTENIGQGYGALSWLVADVDGDRKADLLQPWQNGNRLGLIVYSWDGTQMKKKWGTENIGQGPNALSWLVADIDGAPDRKVELLQPWQNGDRLGLIVYGWDGTKMTTKFATGDMGQYTRPDALSWLVADVDGDRKADLLQPWQNGNRLGLIVYSWDGAKMKRKWSDRNMDQGPNALSWLVADVDGLGDNKTELLQLWDNAGRLGLIVYGWDGTKMVTKSATGDIGQGSRALSWLVADVDGLGKVELLQPWHNKPWNNP